MSHQDSRQLPVRGPHLPPPLSGPETVVSNAFAELPEHIKDLIFRLHRLTMTNDVGRGEIMDDIRHYGDRTDLQNLEKWGKIVEVRWATRRYPDLPRCIDYCIKPTEVKSWEQRKKQLCNKLLQTLHSTKNSRWYDRPDIHLPKRPRKN